LLKNDIARRLKEVRATIPDVRNVVHRGQAAVGLLNYVVIVLVAARPPLEPCPHGGFVGQYATADPRDDVFARLRHPYPS